MNFMADSFDFSVGDRVRRARQSRGIGVSELSYAVNISHDRLSACERGIDRFATLELFRIARMLRINPAYLLGANVVLSRRQRPAGAPANDNANATVSIAATFARMLAELTAILPSYNAAP